VYTGIITEQFLPTLIDHHRLSKRTILMATNNLNNRMYYSRETQEQAQRERFVLALIVLALGVGFGAAVALLFAPQTGDRTRRVLTDSVGSVVEKVRDEVEERIKN